MPHPESPTTAQDFAWSNKIDTSNQEDLDQNSLYFSFEDNVDVGEYSMCGWMKAEIDSSNRNSFNDQILMRLTTNDPIDQSDDLTAGDRTLVVFSNPLE